MDPLGAALLTYLLHSSVLLGAAALVRLALRERRLALQEALLRAAMVGGFLTAGLQLGLGFEPMGGSLQLAAGAGQAEHLLPPAVAPIAAAAPPRALAAVSSPGWPAVQWTGALALAWAALAFVALVRLAQGATRLRRLLRGRRSLGDTALAEHAAQLACALGLRRPVAVSEAQRLSVPLATGLLRPEVCLPTRALEQLPWDEQSALVAHELAHVARRDPAWLLLARLIEASAPLQPLNFWARRRLQDLAECLSDDRAVAASAGPLGLARSLVDVAAWWLPEFTPVGAASAVSARSRLGHRVERLMDPKRTLERPARLMFPLAVALVLGTALVTPVVSGRQAAEPLPPASPEPAAQAEEAPLAPEPAPAPRTPRAPRAPRTRAPRSAALPAPAPLPRPAALPAPAAVAQPAPPVPPLTLAATQAELQRALKRALPAALAAARPSDGELAQLRAELQAMVDEARPSESDLEEIRSLASELARESVAEATAVHVSAREINEQVRAEMSRARGEFQRARAELRRAQAELRKALDEARRAARPEQP